MTAAVRLVTQKPEIFPAGSARSAPPAAAWDTQNV
jgi:hypothetical protein